MLMLPDVITDQNYSNSSNPLLVPGTVRDGKKCRSAKKIPRMIPRCLLLDAKILTDKMRVVSWWFSLEGKEMTATIESLKKIYREPSNSNDRLHRQGSG
jgi:hypothetical protein